MNLNLKKHPKPDSCDVMRCRQRNGLTAFPDMPNLAGFKLCKKHLDLYRAEDDDAVIDTEGETVGGPVAHPGQTREPDAPEPVAGLPTQSTVLAIVEPVRAQAVEQLAQLEGVSLESQDGVDLAAKLLKEVKASYKSLEAQRTSVTKPLGALKKAIDGWFKPAKDALLAEEKFLKTVIADFVVAQEQARVAQLQAGNHEAALAIEPAVLPQGVRTTTTWQFEIVDASKIPREFLVPDAAAIQAHVAANKANSSIPGVRAFPNTGVSAGSK